MRSGMRPLLPELIFVRFVRSPVMPKLIEQPFAAFDLDLLDELFGGEALQIAQNGGETVREEGQLENLDVNERVAARGMASQGALASDFKTRTLHRSR